MHPSHSTRSDELWQLRQERQDVADGREIRESADCEAPGDSEVPSESAAPGDSDRTSTARNHGRNG